MAGLRLLLKLNGIGVVVDAFDVNANVEMKRIIRLLSYLANRTGSAENVRLIQEAFRSQILLESKSTGGIFWKSLVLIGKEHTCSER